MLISSRKENREPTANTLKPRLPSAREPTPLNASMRNNQTLFSFENSGNDSTTGSYDFLPSPSFDDLQTSISNDLAAQFPAPGGQSILKEKPPMEPFSVSTTEGRTAATGRVVAGPRPARAGSLLRRGSNRQASTSSTASTVSGNMDPPSAPGSIRNRRQSQYPPISGSGNANGPVKPPRKSIGPGVIDSDFSNRPSQRRRPSLITSTSIQSLTDVAGVSTRINNNSGAATYTDGARGLTASRAAKTKSLQPPSRQGQPQLSVQTSTPDHNRSSSFAGKSPARNGRGTNTPQSAGKRMSVMPGMLTSASHATGLGARTVSPTDARRAKRLSVLQNPPPMPRSIPNTPPTPQGDASTTRTSSRSPSMLPRKIPTPQSSRTTPDINRKSYSSGQSNGSNASYNTARTSTGSLQPRIPVAPSISRLPTPKTRNTHSSNGNHEEEEEVPPVPAIPKAYESPKESPAEPPFFNKRKSSMPFDASSINSVSTNSLSGRGSIREPGPRETRTRKYAPAGSSSDHEHKPHIAPAKKKNLQPLRLPPLNLLPLSTPTAAKVAALQEPASSEGNITPPRRITKTPSSPMTASKTSFFSWNRNDKSEQAPYDMRSSSSTHHLRSDFSQLNLGTTEASNPIPMAPRPARQQVSPFVSSSLPKHHGEHSFMPRSKTSGDFATIDTSVENRPARLTGPRALKNSKSGKEETTPQQSSPDEPGTPSSTTSLRRKLSLGWKRTTSKSSINVSQAASDRESEYPPAPPKHDNMPPPRLPASATMNSMNNHSGPSPSPSVKSTNYLDSKRRKSSASSLTMLNGHDRTRSDSWGISRSPKKDSASESVVDRIIPTSTTTTTRTPSVMQKMLNSKASIASIKPQDPWTTDLDKDDLIAEEEMKKLASRRKETELAAKQLDALRKRATPKDSVKPQQAIQMANLNIYERGEIIDYKEVYFCGTQNAAKHVGELQSEAANFGYDDERGDYTIATGDHLSYRYEIIDLLGKGSFGQVVRCIDHKTGGLVAIKIIRNKKRFHQQALVEVNILQKLREWVSHFLPLSLD